MNEIPCRVTADLNAFQATQSDGTDEYYQMHAAIVNADITIEEVIERTCFNLPKDPIKMRDEIIEILRDQIHSLIDAEDPKAVLSEWLNFLTEQALEDDQCRAALELPLCD